MPTLICASPSCRALTSMTAEQLRTDALAALDEVGWSIERQPLDLKPVAYCPRCKDDDVTLNERLSA